MITFIQEGGIGVFVMIIWGLCTFAMTIAFVLQPSERKQRFVQAMALAIFMLAVGSTALGLSFSTKAAALCQQMGAACTHPPQMILIEGAGEAIINLATGCSILALVAFVYAFGRLRTAQA